MPSYNHERFLPEAIESVLNQTYRPLELVIVDDGSTDRSLMIAEEYAAQFPNTVRSFMHPDHSRRGISATANAAFQHSKGEYWCGLSSDDAFHQDKLERQVAYMETHPEIGLLSGRVIEIDEAGRRLGDLATRDLSRERDPVACLLEGNHIYGQTVMLRRECLDRVGLHDEDVMYSDWELWIRILAHHRVAFLDRPLAFYRIHDKNTSVGIPPEVQTDRHLEVMLTVQRKGTQLGGALAVASNMALIQLQIGFLTFCRGDRSRAKFALQEAYRLSPALCGNISFLSSWLARRRRELSVFMHPPAPDFLAWFAQQASLLPRRPFPSPGVRMVGLSAATVAQLVVAKSRPASLWRRLLDGRSRLWPRNPREDQQRRS